MSHGLYFGAGNTMIFKRITDERYESADGRFRVQKNPTGRWDAEVSSMGTWLPLGKHNTKRQAIEHCKREA